MAWTTTDLEDIEAAIRNRISGGVASYSINGRSLEYLTLADLRSLRDQIASELSTTGGKTLADIRTFLD